MNTIVLDGDLVLKTVKSMKKKLLSASVNPEDLEIVFNNTTSWDVAGIQLIYAFKRHYSIQDKKVSYRFTSAEDEEKCRELLDLLNIHI